MTTAEVPSLVEPPEPYAVMLPGKTVEPGDLVFQLGVSEAWSVAPAGMHGKVCPGAEYAVAKLKLPDGYHRITEYQDVGPRSLLWRESEPHWENARHLNLFEEETARVVQYERAFEGEAIYLIEPDDEAADHRTIAIPARHREMFPGEVIRRGDRMIYVGVDEWEEVPQRLLGQQVQAPEQESAADMLHETSTLTSERVEGSVEPRFCRPAHPNAQNWYVDLREGAGCDQTGLGSTAQPFSTLEGAQRAIEDAAKQARREPYGVIWDVRGVALFAYDMPEPPPRPPSRGITQVDGPVGNEAAVDRVELPAEPTGTPWEGNPRFKEASESLDWDKRRLLHPGEEIREGDLCYEPVPGNEDVWSWQCVSEQAVGREIIDSIISRKNAPETSRGVLQSRLEAIEQRLERSLTEVREIIRGLKDDEARTSD